jgi:hypothetical protein
MHPSSTSGYADLTSLMLRDFVHPVTLLLNFHAACSSVPQALELSLHTERVHLVTLRTRGWTVDRLIADRNTSVWASVTNYLQEGSSGTHARVNRCPHVTV